MVEAIRKILMIYSNDEDIFYRTYYFTKVVDKYFWELAAMPYKEPCPVCNDTHIVGEIDYINKGESNFEMSYRPCRACGGDETVWRDTMINKIAEAVEEKNHNRNLLKVLNRIADSLEKLVTVYEPKKFSAFDKSLTSDTIIDTTSVPEK
jgi:hypothetical protein